MLNRTTINYLRDFDKIFLRVYNFFSQKITLLYVKVISLREL